jgi:hypothetical protein
MLMNLDDHALKAVMRPKVHGAWILHQLFRHTPLDLFIVFSALPSLLGWVGQGAANYAAANAFLDGLAHYRRARKLPAVSISWGPWSDVGVAARTQGGLAQLAKLGVGAIKPERGLAVLEHLIREDSVHTAVAVIDWPQFFRAFPDAAKAPLLSAFIDEHSARQNNREPAREAWDLDREKLLTEDPEEVRQLLQVHFREILAKILRMPASRLNLHQPLAEVGVDSLMALEFRSAILTNLGVAVPLVRILQGPSLTELVSIVADQITDQRRNEGLSGAEQRGSLSPQRGVCNGDGNNTKRMLGDFSDQEVEVMLESVLDQKKEGAKH